MRPFTDNTGRLIQDVQSGTGYRIIIGTARSGIHTVTVYFQDQKQFEYNGSREGARALSDAFKESASHE